MDTSDDKVKLRVYHRTQKDIVLLWSAETLTDDQRDHVKIQCEGKPLQFATTQHKEDGKMAIAKNTTVCVIEHEPNGLQPGAKYNLHVILGGVKGEPIMRKITVLEYGVLPAYEKDRKSARVHLMAWDYAAGAWVKVPAIRNGKYGYAIPVISVPPEEMPG